MIALHAELARAIKSLLAIFFQPYLKGNEYKAGDVLWADFQWNGTDWSTNSSIWTFTSFENIAPYDPSRYYYSRRPPESGRPILEDFVDESVIYLSLERSMPPSPFLVGVSGVVMVIGVVSLMREF